MSDLTSGRYPDSEEEWLLDGAPGLPYRRNMSRKDITSAAAGGALPTTGKAFATAVPCQIGDIIGAVTVGVAATASGTLTHAWAALYAGTAAASPLITQSADLTSGTMPLNAGFKFTFAAPYLVGGSPGVTGPSGPAALTVVVSVTSATMPTLDGMLGGSAASNGGVITGQLPLSTNSGSTTFTATAPATLAAFAAAGGFIPYVLLSRS
jgi:hypothetical protein